MDKLVICDCDSDDFDETQSEAWSTKHPKKAAFNRSDSVKIGRPGDQQRPEGVAALSSRLRRATAGLQQ